MANIKGKFIVIEGSDGSGKATQAKILKERLIQSGYEVRMADFPQYEKKSAGLVEEYLNGKYGPPEDVGPYRASVFYACDRYDASFKIKSWLEKGYIVISNRYTASNMAHQGGKIFGDLERRAFLDWVNDLEYNLFEIPKPDINIILHVEARVAQKLIEKRNYLQDSTKDIHEKDLNHLRQAEKIYLSLATSLPDFTLIKCTEDNRMLDKITIHKKVWEKVAPEITSRKNDSKLLVKKIHAHAILPTWDHQNNAILNVYSLDHETLVPGKTNLVKAGVKIKIPLGYIAFVHGLSKMDSDGIYILPKMIDNNFSDEIIVNILNMANDYYHIQAGQKIAQIVIQKLHDSNNI